MHDSFNGSSGSSPGADGPRASAVVLEMTKRPDGSWYFNPRGPAQAQYDRSPAGRARRAKYDASVKGRDRLARYHDTMRGVLNAMRCQANRMR